MTPVNNVVRYQQAHVTVDAQTNSWFPIYTFLHCLAMEEQWKSNGRAMDQRLTLHAPRNLYSSKRLAVNLPCTSKGYYPDMLAF